MVLATLAAVAAMQASPVDDYFPMTKGNRWTYEDTDTGLQSIDSAGAEIDLGKAGKAIPISQTVAGRDGGALLYRVQGDTLMLVGFDAHKKDYSKDYSEPQPILRVSPTGAKLEWQFTGEVPSELGPVLFRMTGWSAKGPRTRVLDREVDTIKTHLTSRIGNDKNAVEVNQDILYGKGIGMIQMTETSKSGRNSVKRGLKLVKFESAAN